MATPPPHIMFAPTPSQLSYQLSPTPLPLETPLPKKNINWKKYLPGIFIAICAILISVGFYYAYVTPLPEVSSTKKLAAPTPMSNNSLETAFTPERIALIEKLIGNLPYQNRQTELQIQKPSPGSDVGSVLTYLIDRGANLDGHAWSDEALRALKNRSNWKPKANKAVSSFAQFVYPAGFDTSHPFLAFFSPTTGDWGITSSVDAPIH